MNVVLVKNNNNYDIIAEYTPKIAENLIALNQALESELPIIGMAVVGDLSAVRQQKLTATYGSTWDGTSFSGGRNSKALEATEEQLDSFDLYVFLCNNVLVGRIGIMHENPQAEMYRMAFQSEVILVKVPDHQNVYVGETYKWNGTEFLAPE